KDGYVLHSYDVDREKLRAMLRTTSLSNFQFLDSVDDLKEEMAKLKPKAMDGPLLVPADHAFDVKGVGTVVLGVVRQGSVKVYDDLVIMPTKKSVVVKSIQMHDDPVQISHSPSRVGLAIKGAIADDISRGDVICVPESVKVSGSRLSMKFTKSPFFKGELLENQMYMISVGMQIRAAKIKMNRELDMMEIILDKPVAYQDGQICVVLKPDSQESRIIGKGTLQ
ncbi:MAG: EF-Tu/IF-2/RF-3 family GTPase, partial [Nitrososphaera sp.]